MLKMIPAKSRAAINSVYIKLMVENKTRVVIGVESLLLSKVSAKLETLNLKSQAFHQNCQSETLFVHKMYHLEISEISMGY